MSGAKKIEPVFEDPINAKIQRKFDIVFSGKPEIKKDIDLFSDDGMDFDMSTSSNKPNDGKVDESPSIDLDFSMDDDVPAAPIETKPQAQPESKGLSVADDSGLEFSLDFDSDSSEIEMGSGSSTPAAVEVSTPADEGGFSLDGIDMGDEINFDEATKKTIVINKAELSMGSTNSSADFISSEEARANIESTIKDILRPKFEETPPSANEAAEVPAFEGDISDIEDSVLDFGGNTPSQGFTLSNADDDFSIESTPAPKKAAATAMTNDSTGEFNISTDVFDVSTDDFSPAIDEEEEDDKTQVLARSTKPAVEATPPVHSHTPDFPSSAMSFETSTPPMGLGGGSMSTEDSMRFQATIRALREEREEFLAQIKTLKADSKELEQDNLTLKANLDEAKIEITILRKRHMVELEDLKYRLSISEEKKAMADEKARQADLRREKLEQKVRIDFNQVKQREKELESKLELLSMDVDSQVQSRDQKILELRRKIDALEFNMENASIKEQKSLDDKRKLEDRLNKIMKTLRNSIKNLEDDIDEAQDDDHQKEKI